MFITGGWNFIAAKCSCGFESRSLTYRNEKEKFEEEMKVRSRYLKHLEEMRIRGLLINSEE